MIKPLTSLRFFFALMVLMCHFHIDNMAMFKDGYIGVGFFFILSGFILSYSYIDRFSKGFLSNIKGFYVARFARIYPLHLITLLLMVVLYIPMFDKLSFTVFLSNLFLVQSWIPIESYYYSFNAPSWSISNEMFFYMVFPFLLVFIVSLSKYKKVLLFVLFVILYFFVTFVIVSHFFYTQSYYFVYLNPFFRLMEFIIGIYLFLIWQKINHIKFDEIKTQINKTFFTILEIFSLSTLFLFLYFSKSAQVLFTWDAYYWIPMSFIILVFSFSKGYISNLLSNHFFVYLGEISFAFYMFHWIVLQSISVIKKLFQVSFLWQIEFIIVVLLTLIASAISYKYIEQPANRKLRKILNASE